MSDKQPQDTKTVQLSEKYVQKLANAHQAAQAAVNAAEEAARVANDKKVEAQRALGARADIYELVYEAVGAPPTAKVDWQVGTLTWTEPKAPLAQDIGKHGVSERQATPAADDRPLAPLRSDDATVNDR